MNEDLQTFAQNLGKGLYQVNAGLSEEKLRASIEYFARTAPLPIGEEDTPGFKEFVALAMSSYGPAEEDE